MAIFNIKKVTSFASLVANTVLLKKAASDLLVRIGVTNASGNLVGVETLFNTPKTGSASGTFSADLSENIDFNFDLTGNLTVNFDTDAPSGLSARYMFRFKQDGTGGRTVTWNASGSTVTWQGGTEPVVDPGSNKVTIVSIYWDGSTYFGNKSCGY